MYNMNGGAENGQFNVPLVYTWPGKSRLQVYTEREQARLKAYRDFLVEKGMKPDEADAYMYRLSHVPMPNPGPERDKMIAEEWLRKHTFKKAGWDDAAKVDRDIQRGDKIRKQENEIKTKPPSKEENKLDPSYQTPISLAAQSKGAVINRQDTKKGLITRILNAVGIKKGDDERTVRIQKAVKNREQLLIDKCMKNGMNEKDAKAYVKNLGRRPEVMKKAIVEFNKAQSTLEKFKEKHEIGPTKNGVAFSEKEQKWYGWSHRAIHGFGIGSEITKGDVLLGEPPNDRNRYHIGQKCKSLEEAKQWAKDFGQAVS